VLWFWAAYLMTTDKRGISALLLQRQLELRRYETAWMMLHKLRRARYRQARRSSTDGEVLTRHHNVLVRSQQYGRRHAEDQAQQADECGRP